MNLLIRPVDVRIHKIEIEMPQNCRHQHPYLMECQTADIVSSNLNQIRSEARLSTYFFPIQALGPTPKGFTVPFTSLRYLFGGSFKNLSGTKSSGSVKLRGLWFDTKWPISTVVPAGTNFPQTSPPPLGASLMFPTRFSIILSGSYLGLGGYEPTGTGG